MADAEWSMTCPDGAWTFNAWKDGPQPGCDHRRCSWCPKYALRWRARLLDGVHPELDLV